jgi:NAD(P)-dependent dehydrogenase (short-subunit alcohol dehydrogenase family)
MGRFDGRTAVVTGAARGIGRACAELLAAGGARVAVADIAPEGAEETARRIVAHGGSAVAYPTDVTSADAVEGTVAAAERELGPVTLAVGAAGIMHNRSFLDLPEEGWDTTLAVNLKGMFLLLQAVGRRAVAHGGGAMVGVASVAGRGARPTAADYAASKAGVISLVRSAAEALAADQVRVNAICPGVVETDMTTLIHREKAAIFGITPEESLARQAAKIPLGRLVSAEEVAGTAAFLLSPDAGYITGQALNVCGGLEMD